MHSPRTRGSSSSEAELADVQDLYEDVKVLLQENAVESPETDARWIIEAATGRSPTRKLLERLPVGEAEVESALAMARRRADGEPLQYVTGIAGFRYLELAVGPGVLIPRPETEVVTEVALARLPRGGTLVDVGTGSGAIALAVATERADARVFATERSEEAFAWAVKNRDALGAPVEVLCCDLFDGIPAELRGKVDVVVANAPYVATGSDLPPEVVQYEPPEALFAGGDGLDVIRRLVDEASVWLRPDRGWLVLEVADDQADAVSRLLDGSGYTQVTIDQDLTGRDRIVSARC